MATKENLEHAFAGESQANRKYLAYAKRADDEGYPQIAKLFRAAAEAETIHAFAHLRAMGEIKSTEQNLRSGIEGEGFEFQDMYPRFIEQAHQEGQKAALNSFQNAMAVEQVHHSLYNMALGKIREGEDFDDKKIFVCGVCGNTVLDEKPAKCPVCGAPAEKFFEVE